MDKIKIGMIGLGARGSSLLKGLILKMEDIEVTAVCDVYEDRCQDAADAVKNVQGEYPKMTKDYRDILSMSEVDAIVISSSWVDHIQMAVAAMEAGKYVACEVGGAYSIQECWRLVEAYERTNTPCMILENCCYGRDELMVLHMAELGVFGEIVHASGGYHHDLRKEIAEGNKNRHYRLSNYLNRNCENYPTHEIGPIAKILGINRGNRMLTLQSVSSKARGMSTYLQDRQEHSDLAGKEFKQGDIVTTTIRCANGETITLTLDTTLPRYYSRGLTVRGTKGMYVEDNHSVYIDGQHDASHFSWKDQWGNAEQYREQYEHPIWQKYLSEGVKGGHGGMDWLVFSAFFDSVKQKTDVPLDVYDMAAWMSISALSEESIALGGQPVMIPDFTNGKWMNRK